MFDRILKRLLQYGCSDEMKYIEIREIHEIEDLARREEKHSLMQMYCKLCRLYHRIAALMPYGF